MPSHARIAKGGWHEPTVEAERDLCFSFKHLDLRHPLFTVDTRDRRYFRRLLDRLRELSAFRVDEFTTHRSQTLRIHPIDFERDRLAVNGFGVIGWPEADTLGWQFSLSANEHGRVHGFLSGDTFYVRWLDPDHRLYSSN